MASHQAPRRSRSGSKRQDLTPTHSLLDLTPKTFGRALEAGLEYVVDAQKFLLSLTGPPERALVTGIDGATMTIDAYVGNHQKAENTAMSIGLDSVVEAGSKRMGLPGKAAGKVGAAAGAVYDQLTKQSQKPIE